MDAPEAWDLTTGVPSIIVAVLDVGVQQDHPDIVKAMTPAAASRLKGVWKKYDYELMGKRPL